MIRKLSTFTRLPALLALALAGMSLAPTVRAQAANQAQLSNFDPSDVYFQGYLTIRDAEKLEAANDFVGADDKLQHAKKMLDAIRTYYPDWKADMVKGRMAKTDETIARVKPKADEIRNRNQRAVAELEGGVTAKGRVLPPNFQPAPIPSTQNLDTLENQRLFRAENEVRRLQQQLNAQNNADPDPSRNASRVADLQAQRNLLESQLKAAQNDLAAMRAQLAAAPVEGQFKDLNRKIDTLQQERDAMGIALNQSRAQQLENMSKIETLKADVKALQQNKADLERDLKLQTKTAAEVVAGLRAQMRDLDASLKKKDEELATANKRIEGLVKQLDESHAAYAQLQSEHHELLQERDQMKALLKLNEAGRIKELIEQNVDLAKKFREASTQVERLSADNNATKDELTEALRDFAIAKSQINKLQRERREQDQRIADLEKRLKDEESNLSGGDPSEVNMLREVIKKQLLVQERRRQAKDELIKAVQQLGSNDQVVQQAIKQLDGQEIQLSPEEQKLIAGNADADLVSPFARDRRTVEGAIGGVTREIEGYDLAAKKAFSAGRLLPARELYELSVEANPGDMSSICKLGFIQTRLEDWMSAVETFRRATELDGSNPYAQRMLGFSLMRLKDYDGAEQSLRKAIELAPEEANSHLILGAVYFRKGRNAESESAYRAAIAANPNLSEPHYNLAFLYSRNGRAQEGLEHYKRSLELNGVPDPELEARLESLIKSNPASRAPKN